MKRLLFLTLITGVAGQTQTTANNGSSNVIDALCTEHGCEKILILQKTNQLLAEYAGTNPKPTLDEMHASAKVNNAIVDLEEGYPFNFEFKTNSNQKPKFPRFTREDVLSYDPYTSRRFLKRQEKITQRVAALIKALANDFDNQQL